MNKYQNIVEKIHALPFKLVSVSSGGGTNAISSLLQVPGASNTILESYIPYSKESMNEFLNSRPDKYCSLDTCLSILTNLNKSDDSFYIPKTIKESVKNKILGFRVNISLLF